MINTMFLIDEGCSKGFNALTAPLLSSKRLSSTDKININTQVIKKTTNLDHFEINKGRVFIEETNQIFRLEHIPGYVDIVLPTDKKLLDWVVLLYDQDRIVFNVSYDKHSIVRIHGNGSRIMGYDEPLICDIPFMSLKLTYVNDIDGWIVT